MSNEKSVVSLHGKRVCEDIAFVLKGCRLTRKSRALVLEALWLMECLGNPQDQQFEPPSADFIECVIAVITNRHKECVEAWEAKQKAKEARKKSSTKKKTTTKKKEKVSTKSKPKTKVKKRKK